MCCEMMPSDGSHLGRHEVIVTVLEEIMDRAQDLEASIRILAVTMLCRIFTKEFIAYIDDNTVEDTIYSSLASDPSP
jgi:hypothetical protein